MSTNIKRRSFMKLAVAGLAGMFLSAILSGA